MNLKKERKELFEYYYHGSKELSGNEIQKAFASLEIEIKNQDRRLHNELEEQHGIQKIQDNLKKSFKGTFRDALKNGYKMDKHYVIVDWIFFHDLLNKKEIDKIFGDEK